MTRSLRILYIAAFLGILLGLGLWSLGGLARFQRSAPMSLLDGHFTKALETHYDDAFPIKRLGTNLWAALDYKLFDEGRPGVVLGRDQWLYSDEEFEPVADSSRIEADNLALIGGVRERLQAQGVQLVLAILPAKARLYPEHFGKRRPATLHGELYQRFHAGVEQAGVFAPDLLAPLQRAKASGPVFLRTDTHWTPAGAEVVARQLSQAIASRHPLTGDAQGFVTDSQAPAPYTGDLTRFLPLDPLFSQWLPAPDLLAQRSTQADGAAPAASADEALFASQAIAVALVGTSYSANPHWNFLGALQQSLGRDVVNYAENGHGPLLPMLNYLQTDAFRDSPPQLLIWEFPERYLPMRPDLSSFDPHWIAQLAHPDGARTLAVDPRH
jgi:alginate O-acetyltransferase complex protein AlgJ